MIKAKELELFEKKMQDKKYCKKQGSKILERVFQQIKNPKGNDLPKCQRDYTRYGKAYGKTYGKAA